VRETEGLLAPLLIIISASHLVRNSWRGALNFPVAKFKETNVSFLSPGAAFYFQRTHFPADFIYIILFQGAVYNTTKAATFDVCMTLFALVLQRKLERRAHFNFAE